jgi:hypothetical protein
MDTLSMLSTVLQAKDQVSCDLDGEAAILNMKTGLYYCLDPVGARIWNLIQQPKTLQEIRDTILNEYEVEPVRCESDLVAVIRQLEAEGLIEVKE